MPAWPATRQKLHVSVAIERLSISRIAASLNSDTDEKLTDLMQLKEFEVDFPVGQLHHEISLARGYFVQLGLGPDADSVLIDVETLRDNIELLGAEQVALRLMIAFTVCTGGCWF